MLRGMEPDPAAWDQFVQDRNGHLLQMSRWGALKREFGWADQVVAVGDGVTTDSV
jgi:hypothetical protein